MTALKAFDRLESGGLWRESPGAETIEATVSFGKATLVIANGQGLPLTHWSLPAITRQNPGTRPAIFATDNDDYETLEIDDDLMIDAIETVRKTLDKARPAPPRLRFLTSFLVMVAIIGGAVVFGPTALKHQTLSAVPSSKRAELGATVLGHYQRLTGTTCRAAQATVVLDRLKTRLLGRDAAGQIVVVQNLPQGAVLLPGGIIMLDRALVEQQDDVAVTAGFILAAVHGFGHKDALGPLLDYAGTQATFTLFTRGDLPNSILSNYAQALRMDEVQDPDAGDLADAFQDARLTSAPYAQFRDPTGQTLAQLATQQADDALIPLMSDSDWVRLQGICDS